MLILLEKVTPFGRWIARAWSRTMKNAELATARCVGPA
jgi:hypothetical protein